MINSFLYGLGLMTGHCSQEKYGYVIRGFGLIFAGAQPRVKKMAHRFGSGLLERGLNEVLLYFFAIRSG